MTSGTPGRRPKYFFVAFGAKHAVKNPVEGLVYPHKKGYVTSSGIAAGDVLLLYCCEGYPRHDKEAPGIGVVTGIQSGGDGEAVCYQYFPLCHPVDWDTIKANIDELPRQKTNFSLAGNLLREIGSRSFRAAIAGRQVDWP